MHEPVNAQHHPSLLELFKSLHTPYEFWTHESLQKELKVARGWVTLNNQKVVAFILYREGAEADEIMLLATHPLHQRKGLITQLFGHWLSQRTSLKPIWLEVHEKNLPARNLYRKLSFRKDGMRPRYYPDGGAAINMTFLPSSSNFDS